MGGAIPYSEVPEQYKRGDSQMKADILALFTSFFFWLRMWPACALSSRQTGYDMEYPFFHKLFVLLCFNTVAGTKLEHIIEIVSILLSATNIGMIRGKLQTFQCLKNKRKGKPKASCFLFATNQLRFPYNHSHLELAGAWDNPWGFIRCWDKENTIVFVLFFFFKKNNDLCVYFILWLCMHQSVFTCIPWV